MGAEERDKDEAPDAAMDADPSTSYLFVGSLEKGMRVLSAFQSGHAVLNLAEIAGLSGLDKSAAQRFTFTLNHLGYLRKDPVTKRYSLSPKVMEFGARYLQGDTVVERARPHLMSLHRECRETVNFTELDDTDVVYVSRFPGQNVVQVQLSVGMRAPAYATATGRAMLAFMPRQEAERVLDRSRLLAHTPTTIADRAELLQILDGIRSKGHALTGGEYFAGVIAIAAPVFDLQQRPVAAISISVPQTTWTVPQARTRLVPLVIATAKAISAEIGGAEAEDVSTPVNGKSIRRSANAS